MHFQARTDGTLGTDQLHHGSVRAQSPNLGTRGFRSHALAGTPFSSILQSASPSRLSSIFQQTSLASLSRLSKLSNQSSTNQLQEPRSIISGQQASLSSNLFDINSASKANLVAMLRRLRDEQESEQEAESELFLDGREAIDQVLAAQRLRTGNQELFSEEGGATQGARQLGGRLRTSTQELLLEEQIEATQLGGSLRSGRQQEQERFPFELTEQALGAEEELPNLLGGAEEQEQELRSIVQEAMRQVHY